MIECYDLHTELLSFDFFGWLVQRKREGVTDICFDVSSLKTEEQWRRFLTILWPGPALAGMEAHAVKHCAAEMPGRSRMGHLVAAARSGPLPRLRSVLPPGKARYTVTLRRQAESAFRNSNEHAWRTFAAEIGAHVIEDYDDVPTPLHERMALYAGAELNLGVCSGPMVLCTLTDYPSLSFKWGTGRTEIVMLKYGVKRLENMPWCGAGHITSWEDDTLDNLRRAFGRWQARA